MNKIVREHYPVDQLPEDLRVGLDAASAATVTVVQEEQPPEHVMTLEEMFAARQPPFLSADEIDEHIRSLRDGWER